MLAALQRSANASRTALAKSAIYRTGPTASTVLTVAAPPPPPSSSSQRFFSARGSLALADASPPAGASVAPAAPEGIVVNHLSPEPFFPIPGVKPHECETLQEAVSCIKSGQTLFVHGGMATPLEAMKAVAQHGKDAKLQNVRVVHIHTEGALPHLQPEYEGIFRDVSLFTGANARQAVNEGRADFMPVFLSEIPRLFRSKRVKLDVAIVHLSPPDAHGYASLGVSVDCARAAVQSASTIIGVINKHMPRSHGDGMIHISHIDHLVRHDTPIPELNVADADPAEARIGKFVAENLVQDGATLQMGIGSIPNAVLSLLKEHKDLGIHTEMFSDGVVDLVHAGAITNAKKVLHPGKITAGFVMGTKKLYDFLHDNPFVTMCDIAYVNDPAVIRRNPRVTAINSAIEVDLTGQVVADSIGTKVYSGVGGQVDFIRGASLSPEGKPIIALPSVTSKGISRIVPTIKNGAGVVTTRAHVHYVVTEYGIADLFGKTFQERAKALIDIAHPSHRESLAKSAWELRNLRV